jgi:uncharacterized protein
MSVAVVATVAFLASGLTFFSGFGLGTLLLPVFALFFPVEQAVALTAVVHFLNGMFKLALVGRHARLGVVLQFGVPAVLASFIGAWWLVGLSKSAPIFSYAAFGKTLHLMPAKLLVGLLLLAFAAIEVVPRLRKTTFPPSLIPLGGLLSGFFGGLSGMQGALRSAFLARAGLTKEEFVGTGSAISVLIDLSRLGVYSTMWMSEAPRIHPLLLATVVLSAFAGAVVGNRYLHKTTMGGIQRLVAALLVLVAAGLISGIL